MVLHFVQEINQNVELASNSFDILENSYDLGHFIAFTFNCTFSYHNVKGVFGYPREFHKYIFDNSKDKQPT